MQKEKYPNNDVMNWGSWGEGEAREGGSKMFSLTALVTKNKGPSKAPERPGAATLDNSGIIDLRSMLASAEAHEERPSDPLAVQSHLPISPFDAPQPAPPRAPAPVTPTPMRPSSRLQASVAMVVAGAALAVAIAGATVALVMTRGPQETPRSEPARLVMNAEAKERETREVTALAPIAPAAPATSEVKAQSEAAAKAKATTAPPRAKVAAKRVTAARRAPTRAATAAPATTKREAPKAPAVDPCNDDLMCAMERATGAR